MVQKRLQGAGIWAKKESAALKIAGTASALLSGGHHHLGITKEMKSHGNSQCYIYI